VQINDGMSPYFEVVFKKWIFTQFLKLGKSSDSIMFGGEIKISNLHMKYFDYIKFKYEEKGCK
jgi:hypothetical protein